MIKINLLSDVDKTSIKWEKINHTIILNVVAVISAQVVLILSVFAAVEYLNIEKSSLDAQLVSLQTRTEARQIGLVEEKVGEYEKKLQKINQIQKSHMYWSKILENFSQIVPEGIKINEFIVQQYDEPQLGKGEKPSKGKKPMMKEKFPITITGIARERVDLLKLESRLKESELFIDLETFESNIVKQYNVDFKYIVYVDKESMYY